MLPISISNVKRFPFILLEIIYNTESNNLYYPVSLDQVCKKYYQCLSVSLKIACNQERKDFMGRQTPRKSNLPNQILISGNDF